MADEQVEELTGGSNKKDEKIEELRPTLFIGVGGTGMEVLLRVRRHILNALWGSGSNRVRVDSLADFPIAQFINFDLDSGSITQSGKSQKQDSIHDLIKFTTEEKVVETFDIDKYCRDDDSLAKYPHIQSWSPLTPKQIRDAGINPKDGASQIRGVSRLYFFDKYEKIKEKIRIKLQSLQAGLSKDQQLKRLDLKLSQDKFRIVVVCSGAGGTGSGSFLDMGWLASWIATKTVGSADVELVLFTPAGFQGANKDETEANGYAALMELETAMRGSSVGQYLTRWDPYDKPVLPNKPYNTVYLVDTGNLASQYTSNTEDVYQMVADALFEDFASADFANKKRSIGNNQLRHKSGLFSPAVPGDRYGEMRLTYYKGYSAFGQSILDTQQAYRRDMRSYVWAGEMLKAFFGVATGDQQANRATDKQRDSFMTERMLLSAVPFSDFPEFSSKNIELKRSTGDFNDYYVVEELLKDKQGNFVASMQQKVDDRIEGIKSGFERAEWVAQVRDTVKQLERDAIRDQDATAEVVEDRVARQRALLFTQTKDRVREQLYAYLDNKEFGGLEYVLSLVEQIKDRLANSSTGLIAQLAANAARYAEIKDAVRTHEYERLMGNLAQAKGGWLGSGEKQSLVVMDQLKTEIANFLKFHLRAKAAHEAAAMMEDLSKWLGEKTGVDAQGRPSWNGLVGEFQAGREAVVEMIGSLQKSIENLEQNLVKDHVTYIQIELTRQLETPLPKPELLREWADESFKDFGGSKALFNMLSKPEDRASLLSKVKRMAERKIAIASDRVNAESDVDPLFAELKEMSAQERGRRFTELLDRAMPWIDANLQGEFTVRADQFKCYIGVYRASDYADWRSEIDACVQTRVGITSKQVSIFTTGISGRAVCYCELTGIPLTVLRGLEPWRASYRKVSEKLPVHTHIDSTQFEHPLVRTDELNGLADDFKYFLFAVMLGILIRGAQRAGGMASYQFSIRPGETLRVGNERSFRKDGLPVNKRDQIVGRVNDKINSLGTTQMAALAVLARHYESNVYAPRKVAIGYVEDAMVKGFAHTLAGEAARELTDRAMRKGLSRVDFDRLEDKAFDRLAAWASPLEGSDSDANALEVGEADAESGPRLKYVVRKELFQEGADDALAEALGLRSTNPKPSDAPAGSVALGAPPLSGAPPLPTATQYMLAINGQQAGPYTQANIQQYLALGQINQQTLVWRQGLSAWLPLGQVPELALPPPLPGGPPPLPGGAPPLPGAVQ